MNFKVWSKREKKFVDQFEHYKTDPTKKSLYCPNFLNPELYELVYSTGLKDGDGREIFEGDIIESLNPFTPGSELAEMNEMDAKNPGWDEIEFVIFKNGVFVTNQTEQFNLNSYNKEIRVTKNRRES